MRRDLPAPDPPETSAILGHVLADRPAGVTLVAIPRSGPPGGRWVDLSQKREAGFWVYRRNHEGANLYWTPAETFAPVHRKPRKDQIARVSWLWADLDPEAKTAEELDRERVAILDRLQRSDPDVLIDSGRGMWGLWRLSEAHEGDRGLEEVERANRALAVALRGDKCAWNVDRLVRLPGTVSWPNKKKAANGACARLAKTLKLDGSRRRSIESILRSVPGAAAAFSADDRAGGTQGTGVEPTSGLRPLVGPTREARAAAATLASLPTISYDDLKRFPSGALRIALYQVDSKGRAYPSRSEAAFAFAVSCARARHRGAYWLSREVVAAALLRAELPISAHILEQPQPIRASLRTVDRAFDAVAREIQIWRDRRRTGRGSA